MTDVGVAVISLHAQYGATVLFYVEVVKQKRRSSRWKWWTQRAELLSDGDVIVLTGEEHTSNHTTLLRAWCVRFNTFGWLQFPTVYAQPYLMVK